MSADLAFSCRCGAVGGVLRQAGPKRGDRVKCHCSDCQAFAHFCGAGERVLDAQGGTDLYNTRCALMMIERGREKLACVHLTEKPTLRWYASCCDTPMFNTFGTGRLPYVTAMAANCDPQRRDEVLGEVTGHLFLDEAIGDTRALKPVSAAGFILRAGPRILMDVLSGDRRRAALFDPETLDPIAPPRRLHPAERAQLDARATQ